MNASDRFVVLRAGLVLPIEPVLLALDLESRGLRLELDGEGLLVGPGNKLTSDDRMAILRWRQHLRAIAAYVERTQ